MEFRTEISLSEERNQINYDASILLVGSCFSENIFQLLEEHKFNALKNPFGILYNPIAINTLINHVINQKVFEESDIFFQDERWHCFHAHSDLSATHPENLLHRLNGAVKNTLEHLLKSSHVFITLGSAWVYRHIATDTIVGNCHKVPNKEFLKELMSVDEVSDQLLSINTLLKEVNPSLNIIYSLSPIRHLKDGFVENALSKAHLLAGIHSQVDKHKGISYFPSYEILIDDLRDYRFYADDMLHPNKFAVNYIWEQFKKVWIETDAYPIMEKVQVIQKKLAHKPFNPASNQHHKFLKQLKEDITALSELHNIHFHG